MQILIPQGNGTKLSICHTRSQMLQVLLVQGPHSEPQRELADLPTSLMTSELCWVLVFTHSWAWRKQQNLMAEQLKPESF